uniref:Uncharacterized protein n=1 Tax=Iconisemion striatum TaxID=60296 RepID=A0A1A7WQS4_9TELE
MEDVEVVLHHTGPLAAVHGLYFFWCQLDPGKPPEVLQSHSRPELEALDLVPGDSAVRPASGSSWKLFFGEGTKLLVENKEERNPEYYILGNKDSPTKVCLATEFTRHNATGNHLFNDTEPARNPKDHRFFSQVAFLKGGEERQCKEPEEVPICEASLEPDMMVNLASLSISILRLIFIKTVVFNVLMTLRLWISQ